jgi:scyllo-inositol 2-dehydrogenase (NADP+)
MTDLRVGLVGYGLGGRVFHAPLIEATDGLALAAVATSRRDEVAAAYPSTAVVPSAEEVWDRVDAVVVSTPNSAHVPIGMEAVRRGVPVVIDKPLASSAAAAEELVSAAERAGVPLTVFQNRRWDGDFLTVRRLLREGALGDVVLFESRYERFQPSVPAGEWRERADPAEGGGTLLDLGAHIVDQALLLFGPAERVYGEVGIRRPGAHVNDDAFIALQHTGGVRSHLWMSAIAPLVGPRFAVSGLRGGFATDGVDPQEDQLEAGLRPGDPEYGVSRRRGRLVTENGTQEIELERGDYRAFYAGFAAWLRGEGDAPVDPRDSLAGLRVMEAAAAYAEQ